MSPNPELMALYGTDAYYLEKIGAIPFGALAQRYLPGIASVGLMHHDRMHREQLLQEAEVMNQLFRAHERERLMGTVMGFKGASALDPALAAFAENLGTKLAHTMSKEAVNLGSISGLLGKAKSLFGGAGKAALKSPKKSLVGWKTKATLGAGALGAGYVGYKGLQTARDFAMQPRGGQRWGNYGAKPLHRVNSYGVAV